MSEAEKLIKMYERKLSVEWKKESYNLLEKYKGNECDFETVVIRMIGKNGNVLRSVKKDDQKYFVEFIKKNFKSIQCGTFDFLDKQFMKANWTKDKTPLSYISKVCHIVNPYAYPIIWDSQVMKNLNINYVEERWKKTVKKAIERVKPLKNPDDVYKFESGIWSGLEVPEELKWNGKN